MMRFQLIGPTSRPASRLPADLPEPPPANCLVYDSEKQWESTKVAQPPAPAAGLRIYGHCLYDSELKCLTLLGQRVITQAEQHSGDRF